MTKGVRRAFVSPLYVAVVTTAMVLSADAAQLQAAEWTYWGGTRHFQRYSPADQINAGNMDDVEIVWRRPAADPSVTDADPQLRISGNFRATPIYVDGVLYTSNGVGLVEAIDPASTTTSTPSATTASKQSG